MSQMYVFFVVLISLSTMPRAALAQISKESLAELERACNITKKIQRATNSDGQIRAEYLTYCESKNGESVIWFEAAALSKNYYTGKNAPWMHIELLDANGNSLYKNDNAWLVEVPTCAGYEFHLHRVPTAARGNVYDFRVSMGGTNPTGCGNRKDPWRDAVATAATISRAYKDCSTPELNANEREICNFLKSNASQAAAK